MASSGSPKISPIESAATNVLTVSNIIKVGWHKYTYTCSGDQLRSFVSSAPSSSITEVENLSCINDPIVVNYMALLEKGIPCTWKYKDEKEKNFEILFTDKMLVRELYAFRLEDSDERLDNLTRLEGLEFAENGVFTWEDFESSAAQFDLFIRSIKNLISRTLIRKDAVPMGEWHLFPKYQQKVYECILSCKYNIHITSTNMAVKPVIRYQSLRPLTPSDFTKPEEVQVLLSPSGMRANLLPYRRYETDDIAAVLKEFKTLFGLDLSNSEDDSSIPILVHVQITHENITKDFPYPAKGIYVITDSNNSYRCEARDSGMIPEIFSNVVDCSNEQKSKSSKWWPYNDHSKEALQILKYRNSVDLSAPSPGVDATMTPNTPGMGNGASSASSPGHNLSASRSSKKRPLETKAYPSPPDVIPSNEIQLPLPQNDELPDELMGGAMDSAYDEFDNYYLFDQVLTDADFDTCDKPSHATSPTTNNHTPNASPANEDSPSVSQNQNSLAKHRKQQIDRDLHFEIGKVKLRYCPQDYAPLIFHNEVDMSKYMPGGKFFRATNRKKRKRDFFYTPDYEPAWVIESKKPKALDDNSKPQKEEDSSSESDMDSTSGSSESGSESDVESDSESEFEWKNFESANSYISNSRELSFLNAGRLNMIFNVYGHRQLRRLIDLEVCDDAQSELALQFLREQIVGGSYPFGAGIHGEGESTFEFIESRRRILENLSDDLPTSSALPSEQQEITMSLKDVIEEITVKFPRPEKYPQLSVNGPLSVQEYYNLNGTQLKINNDNDAEPNFQVLETPDVIVCADKFLIETSPEIVKYWDKHNLTPFADRKDVKYFVLYPESESLYYHVRNFFNELRVQYELHCVLGTHEPGNIPNTTNFKYGIVPIRLKQQIRNETELDRMIRSYKSVCEEFGGIISSHTANFEKTQLVIYLINPFDHSTAYYDIFKCYAKFYTSLEKSLKSVSKNILNNVMPQLIPIEHVVRFGENCIRPFRQRPVLKDLAFSVYTRSKSYRPLFILPKPSIVSVSFQLTKNAPPVRELVEYNKILHMSYGFSFDERRLIMVWVDMEGKKLGSYSIPTYKNKNQISLESLYKETWNRTCAFSKHTGSFRQIIITKTGVMTQEEKNLWIKVTEGKVPIFSVDLDTTLDIKPTLDGNGQTSRICGMVLNHPIPVNDFRPEATGFLIEMNNSDTVSNTIQVDLLYNPKNDDSKSTKVMWDVLNQFHILSFMEVTTTRMCLPIHVLMVERCCRVYLGVSK